MRLGGTLARHAIVGACRATALASTTAIGRGGVGLAFAALVDEELPASVARALVLHLGKELEFHAVVGNGIVQRRQPVLVLLVHAFYKLGRHGDGKGPLVGPNGLVVLCNALGRVGIVVSVDEDARKHGLQLVTRRGDDYIGTWDAVGVDVEKENGVEESRWVVLHADREPRLACKLALSRLDQCDVVRGPRLALVVLDQAVHALAHGDFAKAVVLLAL